MQRVSCSDSGGFVMIKRLARWILRVEINNLEHDWWIAGVNQQLHEPETAEHGHMSHNKYWFGID
jgi:hypothetical protein